MKQDICVWILGGDRRQGFLAAQLARSGCRVHTLEVPVPVGSDLVIQQSGPAGLEEADWVVLPLPVSVRPGWVNSPGELPLDAVLDRLSPGQFLCGGKVDGNSRSMARARGLTIRDYLDREELAVANAVPTAEGALQLAMEQLPVTIHGSRVLVLGFGRVGKLTAQRFGALGAEVTVFARRWEQLAWAQAMGFGCHRLGTPLPRSRDFDLVINTVPAPVLTRSVLEQLRQDCLVLDLASQPGGVDRPAAKELGITVVHALGLPGKMAPATAAAAIRETLWNMYLKSERKGSLGK